MKSNKYKIMFFLFYLINSIIYLNSLENDFLDYTVTSNFASYKHGFYNTGIDIICNTNEFLIPEDAKIIFHKETNNSLSLILETDKKLRYFISGLNKDSIDLSTTFLKKNEALNDSYALHIEIQNLANNTFANPLNFFKIQDTIPPVIKDIFVVTKEGEVKSLFSIYSLKRGGKFFIETYDTINDKKYQLAPYKISVYLNGKEFHSLTTDFIKNTHNSFTLSDTGTKVDELHQNNNKSIYFIKDHTFLPGLVGLKFVVEDFAGNTKVLTKSLRILRPTTKD